VTMADFRDHYQQISEADRLHSGPGQLEFARTKEIISRYLSFPARVLDVGGGPGVYASWLLAEGCEVDLVDPVPKHIEQARQAFAQYDARSTAQVGDARSLAFADNTYDAVLLLGPLYHLTERADRIRALAEAQRVVRPGGLVVIAAISRFASLMDGFSRQLVRDPAFVGILNRDLEDGQHRNPDGNPQYFTTAFFHSRAELESEIRESGLELEILAGVEGPFWSLASFSDLWSDAGTRSLMLETLRRIEGEPSLLGASAHWLVVARRPELVSRH
jgi:ubiquinone/menaquinone biosynthesis C-methylase UbiE